MTGKVRPQFSLGGTVTVAPGRHAILETDIAPCGFSIANMLAKGKGFPLFFRLHAALPNCRDGEARLIYEAEAPQDFEDFLVSFAENGAHYSLGKEGATKEETPPDMLLNAIVKPGERLLLNVFNPTEAPITTAVIFYGPAL